MVFLVWMIGHSYKTQIKKPKREIIQHFMKSFVPYTVAGKRILKIIPNTNANVNVDESYFLLIFCAILSPLVFARVQLIFKKSLDHYGH